MIPYKGSRLNPTIRLIPCMVLLIFEFADARKFDGKSLKKRQTDLSNMLATLLSQQHQPEPEMQPFQPTNPQEELNTLMTAINSLQLAADATKKHKRLPIQGILQQLLQTSVQQPTMMGMGQIGQGQSNGMFGGGQGMGQGLGGMSSGMMLGTMPQQPQQQQQQQQPFGGLDLASLLQNQNFMGSSRFDQGMSQNQGIQSSNANSLLGFGSGGNQGMTMSGAMQPQQQTQATTDLLSMLLSNYGGSTGQTQGGMNFQNMGMPGGQMGAPMSGMGFVGGQQGGNAMFGQQGSPGLDLQSLFGGQIGGINSMNPMPTGTMGGSNVNLNTLLGLLTGSGQNQMGSSGMMPSFGNGMGMQSGSMMNNAAASSGNMQSTQDILNQLASILGQSSGNQGMQGTNNMFGGQSGMTSQSGMMGQSGGVMGQPGMMGGGNSGLSGLLSLLSGGQGGQQGGGMMQGSSGMGGTNTHGFMGGQSGTMMNVGSSGQGMGMMSNANPMGSSGMTSTQGGGMTMGTMQPSQQNLMEMLANQLGSGGQQGSGMMQSSQQTRTPKMTSPRDNPHIKSLLINLGLGNVPAAAANSMLESKLAAALSGGSNGGTTSLLTSLLSQPPVGRSRSRKQLVNENYEQLHRAQQIAEKRRQKDIQRIQKDILVLLT